MFGQVSYTARIKSAAPVPREADLVEFIRPKYGFDSTVVHGVGFLRPTYDGPGFLRATYEIDQAASTSVP